MTPQGRLTASEHTTREGWQIQAFGVFMLHKEGRRKIDDTLNKKR